MRLLFIVTSDITYVLAGAHIAPVAAHKKALHAKALHMWGVTIALTAGPLLSVLRNASTLTTSCCRVMSTISMYVGRGSKRGNSRS